MANQKPDYVVYTIIEKNGDADDGSINLSLNALPLNGKLHIREPKSDEESHS